MKNRRGISKIFGSPHGLNATHLAWFVGLGLFSAGCAKPYDIAIRTLDWQYDLSNPDAPPPASGGPARAFRSLQPAVAARGASCLACHAKVSSNLITDFGYQDSYFLDQGSDNLSSGSYYFNHGFVSWQSASITGSLIVPKVTLKRSTSPRLFASIDPSSKLPSTMSLAQFLQFPVTANLDGQALSPPMASLASGASGSATAAPVIEKSVIYIGAPVDSDILSLAPSLSASGPAAFASLPPVANISPTSRISGLAVMGSGAASYLQNADASITCHGDVIVKGTLFLNQVTVHTDGFGCRLYVAGTVFIQGQLTIPTEKSDSTENLQITSSRAILMGFDPTTLSARLELSGDRAWDLPYAHTRGAGTNASRRQAFLDDANRISGLTDASSLDASTLDSISFKRLLLNAPEVHSRYVTPFTGAVIGEIVLFRLNQFTFSFDPVFESVPVLPALKIDVLRVQD